MASDKKIVATEGREKIAGTRYTEIRDIISNNSDAKFKDIIGEIAGISSGSYYNYTSENSPKYGRISLFTAKNLSEFFDLPIGIFDCSEEFSEDAKTKMAEIISNKYSLKKVVKNSSDIIETDFLKKLEYASKMEDKTQKNIIKEALESYFIKPFMNKNHLINYFYLIEKYKANTNKANKKNNINIKRQMEGKNKAFMYCLAYDDLIMQYIRDGEIINFENGIEFKWPNELEYSSHGGTYPHFMDIVLSLYDGNYCYDVNSYDCLDELDNFYDMLELEESDVISMSKRISGGLDEIKNIEWYKQLLEISEEEILEKPTQKFTIDDFVYSSIFNEYDTEPKKMLYLFFEKIKSEGLEIYIQLRMNNVFTIYANENVGNRLAVVSVYKDSIKVSSMYDYNSWCLSIEEIDNNLIKEIVEKYNNQPKRKNMKFDRHKNCFYED